MVRINMSFCGCDAIKLMVCNKTLPTYNVHGQAWPKFQVKLYHFDK